MKCAPKPHMTLEERENWHARISCSFLQTVATTDLEQHRAFCLRQAIRHAVAAEKLGKALRAQFMAKWQRLAA